MLEEIIRQHPEKISALRSACSGLRRSSAASSGEQSEEAKAAFSKAAANYEQSCSSHPDHAITYVRLAECFLARSKMLSARSHFLTEARRHFPDAPEMAYYMGWRYGRLNIRNRPSLL